MRLSTVVYSLASLAIVSAEAVALPWANANPRAAAAAKAFAEAFAEAEAIGHADPEAYAMAASDDDCADISCHAACGYLILNGQSCSLNTTDTYSGPYDSSCLCGSDSNFMKRYPACMDCGWTLWKYYGGYLENALEACNLLTEPTGTQRCSITLTDSYTIDANAGCAYGGQCATSSGNDTVTGTSSASGTAVSTASTVSSVNSVNTAVNTTTSVSLSASHSSSASSSMGSMSSSNSASVASGNGAQLMVAGSSVACAFLLAMLM